MIKKQQSHRSDPHTDNDLQPNGSRRRILRKSGATVLASLAAMQLPKKWQRPVINSVILPAHAQTSTVTTSSTTVTPDVQVTTASLSALINENGRLSLVFRFTTNDRVLDTASMPPPDAFSISVMGAIERQVTALSIENNAVFPRSTIMLTVSPSLTDVSSGQMYTVQYTKPTMEDVLRRLDGSELASFGPFTFSRS